MNEPDDGTLIKAAVFDGVNPVAVETVRLAPPGPGEVRVQVAAAGVCYSELHVVNGEWNAPTPLVLGHEGSGVVVEVGAGVEDLDVGDHVVLNWVPGCGQCRACLSGKPIHCPVVTSVVFPLGTLYDETSRLSNQRGTLHHYLGASTFAEQVVVPRSGAVKVRKDAPLEELAIVGCAVISGVGAVRNTAQVEVGATVAVIGCGGVGLSCIQGARLAGAARIVALDVVPQKLKVAAALGATDLMDAGRSTEVLADMLDLVPDGFDYVFDAVGTVATTEQAIAALGPGGAAVLVGLPARGSRARFEPLVLAEAGQRILGSIFGSATADRDIPVLVDEIMEGRLDVASMISHRRPLSEAAEALADLASGRVVRQLLIP